MLAPVFLVALALSSPDPPTRPAAWSVADLPGGEQALSKVLRFDAPLPRWRVSIEAIRRLHSSVDPDKDVPGLARLSRYFEMLSEIESLSDHALLKDGASLALAGDNRSREVLERLLDQLGLLLERRQQRYVVSLNAEAEGPERSEFAGFVGVDVSRIAAELNGGGTTRISIPHVEVPLPGPVGFWTGTVFNGDVSPAQLMGAILSDRRAAFLFYGLSCVDEDTLTALQSDPELARAIYEDHAAAFATAARSVRVSGGRVQVPGGEEAVALWEKTIDRPVTDVAGFLLNLLERADGVLLRFYAAGAQLDEPHRRFLFGLSTTNPDERRDLFQESWEKYAAARAHLPSGSHPFVRLTMDPDLFLREIHVTAAGALPAPAWRRFWTRVFESSDIPARPDRMLDNLDADGLVTAPWLLQTVFQGLAAHVEQRQLLFLFGQRVFGRAEADQLPSALAVLRGFGRYRTLLLTLERMGITDAATHVLVVRRAAQLDRISNIARARTALEQFQGAIAVVERLVFSATLSSGEALRMIETLARIPLTDGIHYDGRIPGWLEAQLLPALAAGAPFEPAEPFLRDALAGITEKTEPQSCREVSFEWEGFTLDVDLPEASRRSLEQIRSTQRGVEIDQILALSRVAATLRDQSVTLDLVKQAQAELQTKADSLKAMSLPSLDGDPDGIPRTLAEIDTELGRIRDPDDLRRVRRVADSVAWMVDVLTGDYFTSLLYAVHLSGSTDTALFASVVPRRHDFGLGDMERAKNAAPVTPWTIPVQLADRGYPWHIGGSLLALDIALSDRLLRRVDESPPSAPLLSVPMRDAFTQGLAFMKASDLTDRDRDAIAASLSRGRQALETGGDDQLVAADIGAYRRAAWRWMGSYEPEARTSFFSLGEMFAIGGKEGIGNPDAWGSSVLPLTGEMVLRIRPARDWEDLSGRPSTGILAASIPDLNLRLAELASKVQLPACLVRSVSAAATMDLADRVRPSRPDDWDAITAYIAAISGDRVGDYISALTSDGPLMPGPDPDSRNQP